MSLNTFVGYFFLGKIILFGFVSIEIDFNIYFFGLKNQLFKISRFSSVEDDLVTFSFLFCLLEVITLRFLYLF